MKDYHKNQEAVHGKVVKAGMSTADHHILNVTYKNGVRDQLSSSRGEWPSSLYALNGRKTVSEYMKDFRKALRKTFPEAKVR